MTKKPTTSDRFRITCTREIESKELGPIVGLLTKLGFENVHFELITDVIRYNKHKKKPKAKAPKKNKKAKGLGLNVATLRAWAVKRSKFTTQDALRFANAHKMTDSSCWATLRKLRDMKVIRKTGNGQYERIGGAKPKTPIAKKLNGGAEHHVNG